MNKITLTAERSCVEKRDGRIVAYIIRDPEEGDRLLTDRRNLEISLADEEGIFFTEGGITSAGMPDERDDGNFLICIEGKSDLPLSELGGMADIAEAWHALERDDQARLRGEEFLIPLSTLAEKIEEEYDLSRAEQEFKLTLKPGIGIVVEFGDFKYLPIPPADLILNAIKEAMPLADEGDKFVDDMKLAAHILETEIGKVGPDFRDDYAATLTSKRMSMIMDGAEYALSLLHRAEREVLAEELEDNLMAVRKAS